MWIILTVSALGSATVPMLLHAQGRGTPRVTPRDIFSDTGGQEVRRRAPVAAPRPVGAMGTFLATSIDREALPLRDQVVDEDGAMYLVEFDRLVLALRGDKTFRASVRFRRTLYSADPRSRARATPLQNMTVTGTYEITDREIRFTPDPSKETKGLRMLAGRVRSATELEVPFQYRNGTRQRDRTLVMTRRDDIL